MESKIAQNEITFRVAVPNDLPEIFKLVDEYNDGIEIDRTRTKNSLRDFVYVQGVFMVYHGDQVIGGIGGYVAPALITNDIIFNVMFFYIRPQFRKHTKRIILEMELVMLPTRATQIVYGIPAGGKMPLLYRFFKMMGYKSLEIHVIRRLS